MSVYFGAYIALCKQLQRQLQPVSHFKSSCLGITKNPVKQCGKTGFICLRSKFERKIFFSSLEKSSEGIGAQCIFRQNKNIANLYNR